ncbi:MAG: CBM35 domain-containing protein [Bacillota bacterium]
MKLSRGSVVLFCVLVIVILGIMLIRNTGSKEKTLPVPSEQVEPEDDKTAAAATITIEAEDGELTGVSAVADDKASAGKIVEGFDKAGDNLRITVQVAARGTYLITIRYKTYGGDKPNSLSLNGEKIADYTFKDTNTWKDAVIGQFDLNEGANTFDITNSWGWIAVDHIQLFGGPGGPVNTVALTTEGSGSGPSDMPVTLSARADNSSEYRYFYREKNGEWMTLNEYSRRHNFVWIPPSPGEYELKVYARGIYSKEEKQAEDTIPYTALPSYVGKPLVNPMFGENMILQRDAEAAIWGWAEPGKVVTVAIGDKSITATADSDGMWKAVLGVFPAGGPYSLTVSDGVETASYNNILFGDVWLCSGQSNMEFRLSNVINAVDEIKKANYPDIHFITIPAKTSQVPLSMVNSNTKWQVTTSETAPNLSAAAYFFARKLNKETNVPIGIIFSAVGGTNAESWTSYQTLQTLPEFIQSSEDVRNGAASSETTKSPTAYYNGMIAPVAPYSLKGVLWYQGESNWGEHRYNKLLPALIEDWRTVFKDQELPFVIIQISAFGTIQSENNPAQTSEGLPEIREAQLNTVQNDDRTCLVVTTDVGNSADIHPTNKQDVGLRSAICALGKFYNENIEYSGPIYRAMAKEGNQIRVSFDHSGTKLFAGLKNGLQPVQEDRKGELSGFAIAGADHKFYSAHAVIDGDTVLVSSDRVDDPVAVRYNWNDSPIGNLYNNAGLPASPFRTDPVHYLSVIGGTGEGVYGISEEAAITANAPPEGMMFDKWIGDTQFIKDVREPDTTIRMTDTRYTVIAPSYVKNAE